MIEDVALLGGRRYVVLRDAGDDEILHAFAEGDLAHEPNDGGPIGVCVIVTDRDVQRERRDAIWPETSLIYAGTDPATGDHLRVRYFAGAIVVEPLPEIVPIFPPERWGSVFPLDERYTIRSFHESDVPDVLALWAAEGMPASEARRRVHEVVLVATDEDRSLAGVWTAYLVHQRQLRLDVWALRVFVARPHRRSALAVHLSNHGFGVVEERMAAGAPGAGMLLEMEDVWLRRAFPRAIGPFRPFVFIGDKPDGTTVYVHYAPGALAPVPR